MKNCRSLDSIDKRILDAVQRDGRISIVDLAEQVNLSKSPCLQRLRKLERDGFILGYRADLDPQKMEHGHLVYVQVKLESTTRRSLEKFNEAVKNIPEILVCHMLSGGFDYLLKIRTADMAAYRELLGDVISELPCVHQTSSFPVMEEVKDQTALNISL
ncbi:MAG: proline dehydrogenase transcriptional activator [Kordiimonadales bacterium]|nr:MAG: proline dehydrogenase transcriptional activator [Kordiimonadales bacterium]